MLVSVGGTLACAHTHVGAIVGCMSFCVVAAGCSSQDAWREGQAGKEGRWGRATVKRSPLGSPDAAEEYRAWYMRMKVCESKLVHAHTHRRTPV